MRGSFLLAIVALIAGFPVHRHRAPIPHATVRAESTPELRSSDIHLSDSVTVNSTAYCQAGTMADGRQTFRGAVAGNRWPLGTRLIVSDSPTGSTVVIVADRIGSGSQLDFALPGQCQRAINWGRRRVSVRVAP